jgi:hypothetical protein
LQRAHFGQTIAHLIDGHRGDVLRFSHASNVRAGCVTDDVP